jgi:hypothetical protein
VSRVRVRAGGKLREIAPRVSRTISKGDMVIFPARVVTLK